MKAKYLLVYIVNPSSLHTAILRNVVSIVRSIMQIVRSGIDMVKKRLATEDEILLKTL